MKPLVLKDYVFRGRRHAFDHDSARIVGPAAGPAHGFIQIPRGGGEVSAVYADDGGLWFQHGSARWDLASADLRIAHRTSEDGTQVFSVDDGKHPRLEVFYPPTVDEGLNRDSWSFYEQDEAENADLYRLVASHCEDAAWRKNVYASWVKGF